MLRWIAEGRATAERDAAAKFPPGPARQAEVERHRFDLATARAAADLRDGSVTGLPEGSVAHLVDELFTYHADVAGRHGLDLVMYEGGTHVVAGPEWHEDADLTAFLMHLNYTPEMADLYATLLDGWRAAGGGLFNAFVDVAGAQASGAAGARCAISTTPTRAGTSSTASTARPPPGGKSARPAPSTTASPCAARTRRTSITAPDTPTPCSAAPATTS